MTTSQMQNRIKQYEQALNKGRITAREFDGLIEALAQKMNERGA